MQLWISFIGHALYNFTFVNVLSFILFALQYHIDTLLIFRLNLNMLKTISFMADLHRWYLSSYAQRRINNRYVYPPILETLHTGNRKSFMIYILKWTIQLDTKENVRQDRWWAFSHGSHQCRKPPVLRSMFSFAKHNFRHKIHKKNQFAVILCLRIKYF